MTRRNIELILLCVAAPLVVLPFAMLALNDGQALTMNTLGVPLGIFVAFVLAHLSVRKFAPGADPAIWLPTWPCARSCGCSWAWCAWWWCWRCCATSTGWPTTSTRS